MVGSFTSGIGYLLRGFRLIVQPGVRRFVVIPLMINIVVFTVLGFAGIQAFDWLLGQFLPTGDAWWIELVRGVLWLLFAVVALLILVFAFSVVANLIGAPFNGLLSARVEKHLRGASPESGRGLLAEVLASIAGELRKLIYFLWLVLLALLVTVIPVINIVAPLVWVLVTIWMLALEYSAYPMENRGMVFAQTRQTLRGQRALALGFGAAVMVVMMIPLLNFLIMPAAVAGATAMWVERLPGRAPAGQP